MQFVDEATIEVTAGHGGPGAVSFRRESKVPNGGPDGGDGGRGGDVVVVADERTVTLLDHRYRRHYRAEDGAPGGGNQQTGRSAPDLEVPLPVGTLVTDAASGELVADLLEPGQRVVVATAGRGGRGNARFATATRQAPRFAQPGEEGTSRMLALSLKLVADVGLLGLPNAGKSTFLRAVSNSRARVADYPFTTLVPNLGVVRVDEDDFVMADIPGLIEGAHEGHGLGDRFLKHVERTRVLIHLVSLTPDTMDPIKAWEVINGELAARSPDLASKPQIVVLNKIDTIEDRYELELWRDAFAARDVSVRFASGVSGEGTREVLRAVATLLRELAAPTDTDDEGWSPV